MASPDQLSNMRIHRLIAGLLYAAILSCTTADARGLFTYLLEHEPSRAKTEYRPKSLHRDEALALYSPRQQQPGFSSCVDLFPGSRPLDPGIVPGKLRPLSLCSDQFAVLYSQTSKTPLIVVERLTSVQLRQARQQERTNAFFPDPRIPASSRAELADFKDQSGIDRGHQAPAGDAGSERAMAQSFALSNMVAQDSNNNRGPWNTVESDVRKFVLRARGNVFVYTGPLFLGDHANGNVTIGRSVWVPSHLFKLVYDEASGRSWAYILPNAASSVERPVDYATFVARTGWRVLDGLSVTGSLR